jgi:hypothetical protein
MRELSSSSLFASGVMLLAGISCSRLLVAW